jgi:hypothetical protein
MKIVIDNAGFLELERAGKLKKQNCPFTEDYPLCGDWCPHFGEPDNGAIVLSCSGNCIWWGVEDQREVTP